MDSIQDFYLSICRICLSSSTDKKMEPLLDVSNKDGLSSFGKAAKIFSNISLNIDSLPKFICEECLRLLQSAILFKKRSERSDQILKKIVETSILRPEIKQVVCDYVIFNNYFPDHSKSLKKCTNMVERVDTRPQVISIIKPENTTVKSEVLIPEFKNCDSDTDDLSENVQDTQSVCNENEFEASSPDIKELLEKMELVCQMDCSEQNNLKKKYYKQKKMRVKSLNFKSSMKLFKMKQVNNKKVSPTSESERDIVCKVCDKVLANPHTYKNHMQQHTSFRYICEICAKGFAVRAYLQSHQAGVHGFGRFYKCTQCDFKAPRRSELSIHERTHTGERPFACDKCGLTFQRKYCLIKHSLHHLEKTVQCPVCPRKFYQKGHMLAHYNSLHDRMRIYQCPKCSITYAKPATVRRHLIEKHGISRGEQGKIPRICLKTRDAVPTIAEKTVEP